MYCKKKKKKKEMKCIIHFLLFCVFAWRKTLVFSFTYRHLPQCRSSAPLGQSLCPLHCKACGRHSLTFPHGKCPRRHPVSSFPLLACSAKERDAGMSDITYIRIIMSSKSQLSKCLTIEHIFKKGWHGNKPATNLRVILNAKAGNVWTFWQQSPGLNIQMFTV